MTPEETQAVAKATRKLLREEAEERWANTQALAHVLGAKLGGLR